MTPDCGLRKADCGTGSARASLARRSATRNPSSAFTLVELLVAMGIMAVIASLTLGVAAVATETAKRNRTQALIARLHTLMIDHYDQFRNQRVELNPRDSDADGTPDYAEALGAQPSDRSGVALAAGRLMAAREQLRLEMPDRWSDVTLKHIGDDSAAPDTSYNDPTYLAARPNASLVYLRRYRALAPQTNSVTGSVNTAADLRANEGAECLYLYIMTATGDGEARGLFKEAEIADTDGDGAPEFIDGWGRPLNFLRWAPAFVSDSQLNHGRLADLFESETDPADGALRVSAAIAADHDPLDLFRLETFTADAVEEHIEGGLKTRFVVDASAPHVPARGFRLLPLIFSAGSDEAFGLQDGRVAGEGFLNQNAAWRNPLTKALVTNTPFPQVTDPYLHVDEEFLGEKLSEESSDNLHNHVIGEE